MGLGAGFAAVFGFGRETSLGFAAVAFTAVGFAEGGLAAGGGGVTGFVVLVAFLGALVMSSFMVWISLSLCAGLGLMGFAPLPRGNGCWHSPEAAFGGSSGILG